MYIIVFIGLSYDKLNEDRFRNDPLPESPSLILKNLGGGQKQLIEFKQE
jgi:hypothetical protein